MNHSSVRKISEKNWREVESEEKLMVLNTYFYMRKAKVSPLFDGYVSGNSKLIDDPQHFTYNYISITQAARFS